MAMLVKTTRRFVLGGLGAWAAANAALAGAPETSLRPRIRADQTPAVRLISQPESMLAKSGLSGDVTWAVADVKSGLRLESVNGDVALPPASVAKALTTLYALEALGSEYRFKTRLLATGVLNNGIIEGDLILAGGGDPTLSTDDLATMAGRLKAAGVREVRGDFKVYDGLLPYTSSIDPGQPEQVGYSPAVSGIALNYNRVHFEWKQVKGGYTITMDARTERYRPDVEMAVMRVEQRNLPVYTFKDEKDKDSWTVASTALGKNGARWLPVRRPAEYAGDVFRTLARSNGIVLKPARVIGTLPAATAILVEINSEKLSVILRDMLKYSNNLTAEMVGMTATIGHGGPRPSSMKDSALEMSRWAARRFDMKNTRLVDHSGLGPDSRMTADDLVGALVEVHKSGILRPLLKPIAVRDAKGRPVKGGPVKVDAKTGTLNFVSGLGGFMTAPDGTELAFAIFAADTATRSRLTRTERETPQGARGWNARAKNFQQLLISRWSEIYGKS